MVWAIGVGRVPVCAHLAKLARAAGSAPHIYTYSPIRARIPERSERRKPTPNSPENLTQIDNPDPACRKGTNSTTSNTGAKSTAKTASAPKRKAAARRRPAGVDTEDEEEHEGEDEYGLPAGKRLQYADPLTGEAVAAIPAFPGKPLPLLSIDRATRLLRRYVGPVIDSLMEQINEGVPEGQEWTVQDVYEHLLGKRKARTRLQRLCLNEKRNRRTRVRMPAGAKGEQGAQSEANA